MDIFPGLFDNRRSSCSWSSSAAAQSLISSCCGVQNHLAYLHFSPSQIWRPTAAETEQDVWFLFPSHTWNTKSSDSNQDGGKNAGKQTLMFGAPRSWLQSNARFAACSCRGGKHWKLQRRRRRKRTGGGGGSGVFRSFWCSSGRRRVAGRRRGAGWQVAAPVTPRGAGVPHKERGGRKQMLTIRSVLLALCGERKEAGDEHVQET